MSILLVNHADEKTGSIDNYESYLVRHGQTITKISHPLNEYRQKYTRISLNRVLTKKIARKERGFFSNLITDAYLTITTSRKKTYQAYIGANNFDTVCCFITKIVSGNRQAKILYVASDFSVHRFNSFFLNALYYLTEVIALKVADHVISNSYRAHNKRIEMGIKPSKGLIIPNSVYLSQPNFAPKKIQKDSFIYIGTLNQEHGLLQYITHCSDLIKTLVVIGIGPEAEAIQHMCKQKGISLTYLGLQTHEFIIEYLQHFSGFGLAPYDQKRMSHTHYGSSLKIQEYICTGVPVITSEVTEISEEIIKKALGIVYSELVSQTIKKAIASFNTADYNLKAKTFYTVYNQDLLYDTIPI